MCFFSPVPHGQPLGPALVEKFEVVDHLLLSLFVNGCALYRSFFFFFSFFNRLYAQSSNQIGKVIAYKLHSNIHLNYSGKKISTPQNLIK